MAITRFTVDTKVIDVRMNQMVDEIDSAIGQNTSDLNAHKADNVSPHPIYAKKQQENWITATPQNGWTTYISTPKYYKDEMGVVRFTGDIKAGTKAQYTTLFTLPVGYRPTSLTYYFLSGTSPIMVSANTDGVVVLDAAYTGVWISLANIAFRAV